MPCSEQRSICRLVGKHPLSLYHRGDWDPDNSMMYLGAGMIVPREGGCPNLTCCHRDLHKAEAWAATIGPNRNEKRGEISSLAQLHTRLS